MPGQFSVRGGIVDIYCLTEENPWRIELWGDEIDSIRSFDPERQRSLEHLEELPGKIKNVLGDDDLSGGGAYRGQGYGFLPGLFSGGKNHNLSG